MSGTIFVPRVWGGTLILTAAPPPVSALPTLVVVATFRSGEQTAMCRSGEQGASYRAGEQMTTYRNGEQLATYRDGQATTGGR